MPHPSHFKLHVPADLDPPSPPGFSSTVTCFHLFSIYAAASCLYLLEVLKILSYSNDTPFHSHCCYRFVPFVKRYSHFKKVLWLKGGQCICTIHHSKGIHENCNSTQLSPWSSLLFSIWMVVMDSASWLFFNYVKICTGSCLKSLF